MYGSLSVKYILMNKIEFQSLWIFQNPRFDDESVGGEGFELAIPAEDLFNDIQEQVKVKYNGNVWYYCECEILNSYWFDWFTCLFHY